MVVYMHGTSAISELQDVFYLLKLLATILVRTSDLQSSIPQLFKVGLQGRSAHLHSCVLIKGLGL